MGRKTKPIHRVVEFPPPFFVADGKGDQPFGAVKSRRPKQLVYRVVVWVLVRGFRRRVVVPMPLRLIERGHDVSEGFCNAIATPIEGVLFHEKALTSDASKHPVADIKRNSMDSKLRHGLWCLRFAVLIVTASLLLIQSDTGKQCALRWLLPCYLCCILFCIRVRRPVVLAVAGNISSPRPSARAECHIQPARLDASRRPFSAMVARRPMIVTAIAISIDGPATAKMAVAPVIRPLIGGRSPTSRRSSLRPPSSRPWTCVAATRPITRNTTVSPVGISRLPDPLGLVVSVLADPSANGLPPGSPRAISARVLRRTAFGDMVRPFAVEMEDRRTEAMDLAPPLTSVGTGTSCPTPLDLAGQISSRPRLENIGDKCRWAATVCSESKGLGLALYVLVLDKAQDEWHNDLVARVIPAVVVGRDIRGGAVIIHPLA